MSYGESPQVRPNKTPLIYTGADFIKTWEKTDIFIRELADIYNKYGIDSKLNVRDFLLAEMSYNFLAVMHNTLRKENEMRDDTNEGKALLYAVEKTAERTKREFVEKAVNWLDEQMCFRDLSSGRGSWGEVKTLGGYDSLEEFIDEFKQAMEDESK